MRDPQSNGCRLPDQADPSVIFRPSVYEVPKFRIRFHDPEGFIRQTTISTTWSSFADPGDQAARVRVVEMMTAWYRSLGCAVTHIEFVDRSINELIA